MTFYAVVSHGAMVAIFEIASLLTVAALVICAVRFAREQHLRLGSLANRAALSQALRDTATLRYLGDPSCSQSRRWLHQITVLGFLLCFASTCVADFYHSVLGRLAPYPVSSPPVVLGMAGGVLLTAGAAGLPALKARGNSSIQSSAERLHSSLFIILLLLTAVSGLALLAFRTTRYMPGLLTAHLGIVLALFLTVPYTKAVHGLYRFAALFKYNLELPRGIHRP
jgi:citrate/tricarballylate utilization protein